MTQCSGRRAVLCVLALCLLSACGANDGQGTGERPSVTASLSPTRTLPSPTRSPDAPGQTEPESPSPTRTLPSPTRSADPPHQTESESDPGPSKSQTPSDATTPAPTAPSTREPEQESQQPTTRTSTVIAVPVPSATTPTPSDSLSPSPAAGQADGTAEESAVSPAVWVALALLVVAAIVGTWLLVRARKRRSWLTRLNAAKAEVAWFARELVPQLRASGSIDRVVGGWQVAAPRVASAEDQLTVLESSTHHEEDAARALQLRDAVRSAREKMETLSGPGSHDEWALDLDDVKALLEVALGPDDRSTIPAR